MAKEAETKTKIILEKAEVFQASMGRYITYLLILLPALILLLAACGGGGGGGGGGGPAGT